MIIHLQENVSVDNARKISSELSSKRRKDYKLSKYYSHYLEMISNFHKDPKEYEIIDSLKIPDGSPIGTDNCSYFQ